LKKQELDSCWSLHLIYSGAGMTKEQESESGIIGSGAPVCSSNNQQSAMGNQQLRQIPLCPSSVQIRQVITFILSFLRKQESRMLLKIEYFIFLYFK